MVLNRYFMLFLHFIWPINCNHTSWCTKSSTSSSPSWFWLKILSFPWIHGVTHDHVLRASSHVNEWKFTPRIVLIFNIDLTPLWWKFWTTRSAPSLWSWTPSNLILSHFFKLSYLGDFVIGRPHLWWWIKKKLRKFL
jgi:hypothetical protein